MSPAIKYYADEHIDAAFVSGLVRRGIDVISTYDAGMLSASDEEQLAFALREGRVLITHDDDFLNLHARGTARAGIVFISRRITVGEYIHGLVFIHQALTEEDTKKTIRNSAC